MLYKALTGLHPYKLLSKGTDELAVPEIAAIERIPPAAETAAKQGRELAAPELGPICDRALRQEHPSFDSVEDFADALWQALKDPVHAAGASAAQAPNAEADRRRMVILARLAALPFYAVFERRRLLDQLRRLD